MSYRVLARKYRPLNFEALVGQEHVVQALANALTQQRLHHAYLFTGTRGVGKTTVSRILAKSLNCVGPQGDGGITATPCGQCQACRDIDAGRFVDYIELDAASNRGVEEISQLLDQAVYKPVVGRFKVYMIDEVHMLSTTAFNAMLKTLEEPPDYLKFVLATTDPQKVPPTVLSRCLQFNLRPMPPQTVQTHLVQLLAEEQIQAEPGALRLISRAARGSMRDALSLTDQAIAFGAGALSEAGVREMLGAVDSGHAVRIVQALSQGQGAELVAAADTLRSLGLSAAGALEEVAALLQQVAVLQAVPDAELDTEIDTAVLHGLSKTFAADELQVLYSIALRGRAELALAPDEYSGLVMVLLRMLAFAPTAYGKTAPGPAAQAHKVNPAGAAKALSPPKEATPAAAPAERAAPIRTGEPVPASRLAAREPARPAVVASAPASRVHSAPPAAAPAPKLAEPPPWEEAPWPEDEPDSAPPPAPRAVRSRHTPDDDSIAERADAQDPGSFEAVVVTQRTPSAAPAPPRFVPDVLGEAWARTVGELVGSGRVSALVRELAMQSQCLACDSSATPATWRLQVEREMLRSTVQCDKLKAALADWLGRPVELEVLAGLALDSPALRDAAERQRKQAQAEQIIHDDPQVQALMAQFKTARIVPGSVKPH